MYRKFAHSYATIALTSVALIACGGGGGETPSGPSQSITPSPTPSPSAPPTSSPAPTASATPSSKPTAKLISSNLSRKVSVITTGAAQKDNFGQPQYSDIPYQRITILDDANQTYALNLTLSDGTNFTPDLALSGDYVRIAPIRSGYAALRANLQNLGIDNESYLVRLSDGALFESSAASVNGGANGKFAFSLSTNYGAPIGTGNIDVVNPITGSGKIYLSNGGVDIYDPLDIESAQVGTTLPFTKVLSNTGAGSGVYDETADVFYASRRGTIKSDGTVLNSTDAAQFSYSVMDGRLIGTGPETTPIDGCDPASPQRPMTGTARITDQQREFSYERLSTSTYGSGCSDVVYRLTFNTIGNSSIMSIQTKKQTAPPLSTYQLQSSGPIQLSDPSNFFGSVGTLSFGYLGAGTYAFQDLATNCAQGTCGVSFNEPESNSPPYGGVRKLAFFKLDGTQVTAVGNGVINSVYLGSLIARSNDTFMFTQFVAGSSSQFDSHVIWIVSESQGQLSVLKKLNTARGFRAMAYLE